MSDNPENDDAAEDILHDLDKMKGLAGKQWSVEYARKLGWTEEEIKKYLGGKK